MNLKDHEFSYPFSIVTGQGLGTSYSSLHKIPPLFPSRPFGQSKLSCSVNIGNGNLVLEDHRLSLPGIGGPIEFSYLYNSLSNSWKLSHGKEIVEFKSQNFVKVREKDGHEETYFYNATDNSYESQGPNGRSVLSYNKEKPSWSCSHT